MYGKLINGDLITAGKRIRVENNWIYNPPAELLSFLGYKPVHFTDYPEEIPAGYHAEQTWTEDEEKITLIWILVPDEPEEV